MDSFSWREILTSLSILIVFVTFVVGYLERRACDRRRRTLRFLVAIIEGEGPTNRARREIATWISKGRVIEDDKVDSAEDKTIITVLDYYDVISDTATRGVIDEEMIILHLGGRMRSTYKLFAKYIDARRVTLNRPGLYRPFEKFVVERIKDREV
jgi:hypothetical protein